MPDAILPELLFALLGLVLFMYVALDGFDLGIGVLYLYPGFQKYRREMIEGIEPFWHANQTWLVILGAITFGAFPVFYGSVLPGLYLLFTFLILALIFRGAAFEFHGESGGFWNYAFGAASLGAGFCQGLILGALLQACFVPGIPMDSITGYAVLSGAAVTSGYALSGACYLLLKSEEPQRWRNPALYAAFVFLALSTAAVAWTVLGGAAVLAKIRTMPVFFPVLAAAAAAIFILLVRGVMRGETRSPFLWCTALFFLYFAGLMAVLHPFIIPGAMTIAGAAASPVTLRMLLYLFLLLLPVIMLYNAYQYRVLFKRAGAGSGL